MICSGIWDSRVKCQNFQLYKVTFWQLKMVCFGCKSIEQLMLKTRIWINFFLKSIKSYLWHRTHPPWSCYIIGLIGSSWIDFSTLYYAKYQNGFLVLTFSCIPFLKIHFCFMLSPWHRSVYRSCDVRTEIMQPYRQASMLQDQNHSAKAILCKAK